MTNPTITDADKILAEQIVDADYGVPASLYDWLATHRELGAREERERIVRWLWEQSPSDVLEWALASAFARSIENAEHTRSAALDELMAGDADLI